MSRDERRTLHHHWREQLRTELGEQLNSLTERLENIARSVDELHDETRRRVLRSIEVIGVTTNGSARYKELLRAVAPRIVMCEKAAEVLEAHIVSSLAPSTEHLILIGDPKQLRPSIATYELSIDSGPGKSYMLW